MDHNGSQLDPFINSETSQIFIQLMNSKTGRAVAENLLKKFRALSQSFHELTENEQRIISVDLNQKFKESLHLLKEKFIQADVDDHFKRSSPTVYYDDVQHSNFVPVLLFVIFLIGEFCVIKS